MPYRWKESKTVSSELLLSTFWVVWPKPVCYALRHGSFVQNFFFVLWMTLTFDRCHYSLDSVTSVEFTWWRHEMETFSALLAICAENSPVPGEFPTQRPVTRSFGVFFDPRPNKRLSKQSWGWWSETPSSSLWRHRNECEMWQVNCIYLLPKMTQLTNGGNRFIPAQRPLNHLVSPKRVPPVDMTKRIFAIIAVCKIIKSNIRW